MPTTPPPHPSRRMKKTASTIGAVAGAVLLSALIAACGSSTDSTGSARTTSTTTTNTSTTKPKFTRKPARTTTPADTTFNRYETALRDAGIPFRPGSSGTYSADQSTCKSLSEGKRDAYEMATTERVAVPGDDNGERIKMMVPILCPENQAIIDEAASGNAVMKKLTDGKFLVSDDPASATGRIVQPGTYRTVNDVSDCYWERSDAQGNIIDNNFISIAPAITVTILSSDAGFTSERCGPWERVG